MTHDLMPDFIATLERRLRDAAIDAHAVEADPRPRRSRRWGARLTVPALAAVALAGLFVLISASGDHRTPKAYGKPLILQTPPVDASKVLRELKQGMSATLTLGNDTSLTTARPVPAFGGTAFVVTGDRGWCLTAPDPAIGDPSTADPAREGAVSCAPTSVVYKYGISLGVGDNVIAAIPQGVKHPTLAAPDGTVEALEPSDQGVVVAADVVHRSVLTLYAADGTTRSLHLP